MRDCISSLKWRSVRPCAWYPTSHPVGFFYRYVLTQKVEASWPSSLHLDICSDCRCFGPAGSSLAIALIPETRTLVAATHCWGRTLRWPRIPSAAQGGGEYSKMPLVLSYATETGLSSARVGRSLAHARLITPILELKRFVCSQTERLTHHQQQRKNEMWTGVRENALRLFFPCCF